MADSNGSIRRLTRVTLLVSLALVLAACSNAATTHGAEKASNGVKSATPPTTSVPVIGGLPETTTTIPTGEQGGTPLSVPTIAMTSASHSSVGTPTTTSPPRTTPATTPPVQTATPTTALDSVVIDAAPTDRGTVLTNNLGQTLYLLTADSPTRSNCTSLVCTTVWPPVLAAGGGTAGSGVQQSLLGNLHLPDGLVQVTYAGHPLYTYIGDNKVGETNGENVKSFGGIWYAISAATGQAA